MQQYATNACVCIKNRHNAYTEGNDADAYARVGTSIYIAAVYIKKLLSRQVYATKEVVQHMFGLDKNEITFEHWDKDDPTSDSQWFQRAYHRYRKLKYWHVFAS